MAVPSLQWLMKQPNTRREIMLVLALPVWIVIAAILIIGTAIYEPRRRAAAGRATSAVEQRRHERGHEGNLPE
jgi:hypothetical protein